MLPKPVTAFALSALVSIASFTASSAVAATNPSADHTASASASPAKATHHVKKDAKKGSLKKKGHLAALHAAEPKESPKESGKGAQKESPKLAASLSTHLDLKPASNKAEHGVAPKKTTLAATGKEIFIGGPTKPSAAGKAEKGEKLDRPVVEGTVAPSKPSAKLAVGTIHHGKVGPMAKAGRAPSRPDSAASKTEVPESASDEHPVQVALRGSPRAALKVAPEAPCLHDPIEFVRGAETDRFAVTRCDGASAPLAVERLSVLVRPETASRPASVEELSKVKGLDIAPGVRRIDPGLLARLQLIADHFAKPGMPERISIVSGYRPGSTGSFHASAQAMDFHLEGVPNEALVDFCKTLENTGCGYYPNSSFVHVDVRAPGSGHVAWIDTSGPGEPPHYVSAWPPAPEPDVKLAQEDGDLVNPYTASLPSLPGVTREKAEEKAPAASMTAPLKLKEWE